MSGELTKDWPHGWVVRSANGVISPARVISWDRKCTGGPGIVALVRYDDGELVSCFAADGRGSSETLRNAPAPKASGTDWIVRWRCENGYTRSAALHHTEIAAVALANFLRETGRTHVSVTRADWEDGQGLQPEGGR